MSNYLPTRPEIMSAFASGRNCAQCCLAHWADELGYDTEELDRIAACFGGGMFRGDTCGAVTGSLMALGMAFGGSGDEESNRVCHEKVHEFQTRFAERFGSLECRCLLGLDVSVPEEREKAFASGVMNDICPGLVIGAMEITADLMEE